MERRRSCLSRREFVVGAAGLGLVAGCGRLPGQAQARIPRLGVLAAAEGAGSTLRQLMAYAASPDDLARRGAYYVDRILKGAKPADLPVEQPMTFDSVVNLKTAQALGITFPNEILLQVTEVLQ
jgi:ABC transporter substrate binding protein